MNGFIQDASSLQNLAVSLGSIQKHIAGQNKDGFGTDTQPPLISCLDVDRGDDSSSTSVKFTITDRGTNASQVNVAATIALVDGVDFTSQFLAKVSLSDGESEEERPAGCGISQNWTYKAQLNLATGQHSLKISAQDQAGNSSDKTFALKVKSGQAGRE